MERKHRLILEDMYETIVRDLNVEEIITQLISKRVITELFDQELRAINGNQAKARKLLLDLKSRGPNAYEIFKEALKVDHSWMVDEMEELEQRFSKSNDVTDASIVSNNQSLRLPAIPPLNVLRTQKMDQLSGELKKLLPKTYLALHAMQGWGKSTLVGATFRKDQSLYESFKNQIYWMKFRQQKTNDGNDLSDNILNQLNVLLHEVRNSDEWTEPTNQKSLQYLLRKHFADHSEALIILDHAEKREIVDAFDFGCKTLVLTTNINVLEGKEFEVMKIDEGFTVEESLDLFAKAIGSEASSLPKQAKFIHKECKGMPLMISMYAARFKDIKESLIEDKDGATVWSAYLNDLRTRSPILKNSWTKLCATFEMCLKNLTNDSDKNDDNKDDENLYKMLSIFPEDVNITTEMLSMAWNIDGRDWRVIVHAKMLKFYKKSMVVRQWNNDSTDYIYCVHDLMLRFLRDKLGEKKLRDNHKSYVERYLNKCNGDYSKLLRDNYIHAYIGYHMKEADLTDKFTELYLDFGFVESKILQTGSGDLLIDLKKYRKYITRNLPELTDKVEDLKAFLIEHALPLAEYRRRNCLDIVQVALKHTKAGFVRENAERLANERPKRVYFKVRKSSSATVSLVLPMQVRAVAFANESDTILLGTEKGEIVWWNCRNRKNIFFLRKSNATSAVKKILHSEKGRFFIALSDDGTAKLFDLKEPFDQRFENDGPKTSEQWTKQENWKSMYAASCDCDYSRVDFVIPKQQITDITVTDDGCRIAACTNLGHVAIWNSDGTHIKDEAILSAQLNLVSIAYISLETKLCVASCKTRSIIVLEASNCNYKSQHSLEPSGNDVIKSLIPVPGYANFLIALTEKRLLCISWILNEHTASRPRIDPFAELDSSSVIYKSAIVTPDGKYVATSDDGESVHVYKINGIFNINGFNKPKLIRTFKQNVTSLATRRSNDEQISHTICGCTYDAPEPMVHMWKFDAEDEGVVQRTPLFDAIARDDNSEGIIAVATLNNLVKIIQNENEITESNVTDGKITSIKIFDNGDKVVYGTENKSVYIFDVKRKVGEKIMELRKPTYYMKVLEIGGKNVIVCQHDENDLMIWKSNDDTRLVENVGTLMLTVLLDKSGLILTVSNNLIKLLDQDTWYTKLKESLEKKSKCCCLSNGQNYLAIANIEHSIKVLKLSSIEFSPRMRLEKMSERQFDCEITACCFSNDETFLAVGLKSGDITIIRVMEHKIVRTIKFHLKPIKRLYWSPATVKDSTILLSLTNELAWWSIKGMKTKNDRFHKIEGENHAGNKITHSQSVQEIRTNSSIVNSTSESALYDNSKAKIGTSLDDDSGVVSSSQSLNETLENMSPSSSSSTSSTSFSVENSLFRNNRSSSSSRSLGNASFVGANFSDTNGDVDVDGDLWNGKIGAHSKIADLLSVIKLDGNSATKIRMSENFQKFLTVDGEGSIYTIKFLDKNSTEEHS